jgi:hypothetical protein
VIRKLDESDPGWTLSAVADAHNAKLPPDERNPFPLIGQIRSTFPPDYTKADPVSELATRPANVLLRPEERAALDKHMATGRDGLAIARRLADYPAGGRHLVLPDMPLDTEYEEVHRARAVAWLLQWDALASANADRPADAVRDARACLGAGRAIGDEPLIISQLVRVAVVSVAGRIVERTLALTAPAEGLAELQAELLREADFPRMGHAFRGERAYLHQVFLLLTSGDIDQHGGVARLIGMAQPDLPQRLTLWELRAYLPGDHAFGLGMMTEWIEAAQRPFDDQYRALRAAPDGQPKTEQHMFSLLLSSGGVIFGTACIRVRGELLATAAGIACERYRRRFGKWPESLAAIPKEILPAVPTDPFTGQPLVYRRLPDGATVYSVGPDGRDDGGLFRQPAATSSGNAQPCDYGIRLWNPDQRRQPPSRDNDPAAANP